MKQARAAGYSGKALDVKLGLKAGWAVLLIGVPEALTRAVSRPDLGWLAAIGVGKALPSALPKLDHVHLFVDRSAGLARNLGRLRARLKPAGQIWVSWPKRASGVATDMSEDLVRDAALEAGLVDVKVCAVDDVWSGLKLVIPVAQRA
jgi:hypothetical protein